MTSPPDGGFRKAALTLPIAYLLWFTTFYVKPLNFWLDISVSTLILFILSFAVSKKLPIRRPVRPGHLALGVVSAILLYFVFAGGREVARLLPFGAIGIRSIYGLAESLNPVLIAVLLVFPIAVGEEVYWRGTIQTQIARRYGRPVGYAIAILANATVHLPAANPMLLVAALVSSLVWGYLFLVTNDLLPSLVSHVLWDLLVFVILPLNL